MVENRIPISQKDLGICWKGPEHSTAEGFDTGGKKFEKSWWGEKNRREEGDESNIIYKQDKQDNNIPPRIAPKEMGIPKSTLSNPGELLNILIQEDEKVLRIFLPKFFPF